MRGFQAQKLRTLILMSHHSNSTYLFMRINLQLQTSDFVDVDLACDHCHGSSKSQKTHLQCSPKKGCDGFLEGSVLYTCKLACDWLSGFSHDGLVGNHCIQYRPRQKSITTLFRTTGPVLSTLGGRFCKPDPPHGGGGICRTAL